MKINTNLLDKFISKFNELLIDDTYGHINEISMVYVKHGIYNEYKIIQDQDVCTFQYVCGDRMFSYTMLNELKLSVENTLYEPSSQYKSVNDDKMEEYFLDALSLLDDHIFKYNAVEYITSLSIKLLSYGLNPSFIEIYKNKYSYIMYEKMEQYLRFIGEQYSKIISLLYLISILYSFDPMDEYKTLVAKYTSYVSKHCTEYSNEYIQKISLNILERM